MVLPHGFRGRQYQFAQLPFIRCSAVSRWDQFTQSTHQVSLPTRCSAAGQARSDFNAQGDAEVFVPELLLLGADVESNPTSSAGSALRSPHRWDGLVPMPSHHPCRVDREGVQLQRRPLGTQRHDYPFTQTTCRKVCTTSTRSLCAAITASMSLYAIGVSSITPSSFRHSTCAVALVWSSRL